MSTFTHTHMHTRKFAALFLFLLTLTLCCLPQALAAQKPLLTFDEFFNSISYPSFELSPDGRAAVIEVERSDWEQNIYRHDLWLYRDDGKGGGSLTQLTQSGHDSDPQWSPDGRWIAFLSEREAPAGAKDTDSEDKKKHRGGETSQLHLIAVDGGEAFAVTANDEDVHAFAWTPDSRSLYFATRIPWTHAQKTAYKKEWKDVEQYRASERGDEIFRITVEEAIAQHRKQGTQPAPDDEDAAPAGTPGAQSLARSPLQVSEMVCSPDSRKLAFASNSISSRDELVEEFEIYTLDLTKAGSVQEPRRITRNQSPEHTLRWASDNRHVFFENGIGSVEGKYVDTQPRLYWVNVESGATQRWAADFTGSVDHYTPVASGVLIAARLGTEVQVYALTSPGAKAQPVAGWRGTYDGLRTTTGSSRILFHHSSLQQPAEIYLADSAEKLAQARPLTAFNKLFTERELPQGKPYRWTSDDGTAVEGMLIYPPGKFEAKNLPMLTLIHGGPADANGNHFEADWYEWQALAATRGWLVFQPNYRGSTGYGDKFLMQIVPEIVSRPGKDILTGVDALVKDGIADPNRLAISGYSYGGYMTNWLITQTTRFKAAMTGAGAVEHVANWGNDDTTFDDAYFLDGLPWEAAQRYHDEAAIFQIQKVRTPTHMVGGGDDIRVAVLENYLLDHALHVLGIPSTLLIFPGEGHSLTKNPWHGKIKVREELKWLEKYAGSAAANP
jgi:dipeptidyl aminopeptidase/acylaminoacyl peptidase